METSREEQKMVANLQAMLVARGFADPKIDPHAAEQPVTLEHPKDPTNRIMIHFLYDESKINAMVTDIVKNSQDTIRPNTTIMIISKKPLSTNGASNMSKKEKEFTKNGCMLQFFTYAELQYNPLEHALVPKHEKLTDEEKRELFESYMIKPKLQHVTLPLILRDDVISRWLGLRHGDVVRITRYNPTSGQYYFYRSCM